MSHGRHEFLVFYTWPPWSASSVTWPPWSPFYVLWPPWSPGMENCDYLKHSRRSLKKVKIGID